MNGDITPTQPMFSSVELPSHIAARTPMQDHDMDLPFPSPHHMSVDTQHHPPNIFDSDYEESEWLYFLPPHLQPAEAARIRTRGGDRHYAPEVPRMFRHKDHRMDYGLPPENRHSRHAPMGFGKACHNHLYARKIKSAEKRARRIAEHNQRAFEKAQRDGVMLHLGEREEEHKPKGRERRRRAYKLVPVDEDEEMGFVPMPKVPEGRKRSRRDSPEEWLKYEESLEDDFSQVSIRDRPPVRSTHQIPSQRVPPAAVDPLLPPSKIRSTPQGHRIPQRINQPGMKVHEPGHYRESNVRRHALDHDDEGEQHVRFSRNPEIRHMTATYPTSGARRFAPPQTILRPPIFPPSQSSQSLSTLEDSSEHDDDKSDSTGESPELTAFNLMLAEADRNMKIADREARRADWVRETQIRAAATHNSIGGNLGLALPGPIPPVGPSAGPQASGLSAGPPAPRAPSNGGQNPIQKRTTVEPVRLPRPRDDEGRPEEEEDDEGGSPTMRERPTRRGRGRSGAMSVDPKSRRPAAPGK